MLTYNNLIKNFEDSFPELGKEIFETKNDLVDDKWFKDMPDNIPVGIFFSEIFSFGKLEKLILDENILCERLFDFFENMAVSNDKCVVNTLEVEILELLYTNKKILKKSIKYMKHNTKLLNMDVAKGFK